MIVNARDAGAERYGKGGRGLMDRQVMEDHGLEVALQIGITIERGAARNKRRVSLKLQGGNRQMRCLLCAHNFFC